MGRTVAALLIIAAVIAVVAIPGVGAAIGGALVSAGLATTAAGGAALATSVAISVGLAAVGMLLAPTADFSPPETASTPLRTSTPPRVSAYGTSRLYGAYILFDNTTFSVNSDTFAPYALDAFAIHDGEIAGIVQRYLGDDAITLGAGGYVNMMANRQYGGDLVRWYETLGGTPGTANWSEFITKLPGKWTANHRGDGVVCIGVVWRPVSGDEFNERFPQGAAPASIVANWQKVYDPRDAGQSPSNPATWAWSDNAALHLLHYRLYREKARRSPGAALPSSAQLLDALNLFFEPTKAYWIAAANVCDEAVALDGGGSEKRYRSCFAHKHTDAHKATIDALTRTFDGWTSPRSDGALVVYAGKFETPTVSIGPAEIVSYSWQFGVADEETINEIKLTYVSAAHAYNTVDAEPWRDEDDMLERGVRSQGFDFPVPSHGQARRLAKRVMARVMSPNRGVITTNVAGRIVRGQRYINLRIAEAGVVFFDGVAEITMLARNIATGGVTFGWVELTASIDAWNPATEEGEPAPVAADTPLAAPDPPEIASATLIFDSPGAGASGARVLITLDGPSGADLIWFARWRRVGDAVWNEQRYTDVDSSAGVELITDFVPIDRDLEVSVAYMSGTGALSPWSLPATEVSTDLYATAPDAAASITLLEWTDRIVMRTDPIPRASTYRWRFYKADGTTLKRTITTTGPEVTYSNSQAHGDGVERSYKVDVAGVNNAGTGAAIMSAQIDNSAPSAPTGVTFADGTSSSTVTFTGPGGDATGFRIAWSTAASFDPQTQGSSMLSPASPSYTPVLPAATYYGKVAAYDLWTSQPDKLNFSSEDSFVITPGGGGDPPSGDGGGGFEGGGGFGGPGHMV
jgi:hypothetical protein